MGPSDEMREPLYLTNKNNVHFREGPDIGSETLFLLEEGEIISVTRVTPGEYHVFIEVDLDNEKSVQMDGWIDRTDLRLVNLNNYDYAFLGAWNFKDVIANKEREFVENGGKFITHVPEVMVFS